MHSANVFNGRIGFINILQAEGNVYNHENKIGVTRLGFRVYL